jgi:hypothetical protein
VAFGLLSTKILFQASCSRFLAGDLGKKLRGEDSGLEETIKLPLALPCPKERLAPHPARVGKGQQHPPSRCIRTSLDMSKHTGAMATHAGQLLLGFCCAALLAVNLAQKIPQPRMQKAAQQRGESCQVLDLWEPSSSDLERRSAIIHNLQGAYLI